MTKMPTIAEVLKVIAPSANPAFVAASTNAGAIMLEYGIKSSNAQVQLLGHMAVECGGYRVFEENLNYSAQRLTKVWPKRFPTVSAATPYAKNPQKLAMNVYAGRMGNRPNTTDAWDDRGSGGLQHTGRAEFDRVEKRTGVPVLSKPALLRDPKQADLIWRAACSYFADRGCIPPADAGQTEIVCRKVNGGTTGLADRRIMVKRAEQALIGLTIVIDNKTTHEEADDLKRKAKQATVAAPAGAATGGAATEATKPAEQPKGTTTQPDTSKPAPAPTSDHTVTLIIGATILIVVGIVAVTYWLRHRSKVTEIETMELQAKQDRLAGT